MKLNWRFRPPDQPDNNEKSLLIGIPTESTPSPQTTASTSPSPIPSLSPLPPSLYAHDYFNNLVARPDHWKSYSLRDANQLKSRRQGGYSASNSRPPSVTYDPNNDPDPERQDAAKVTVPAFAGARTQLAAPSDSVQTVVTLALVDGNYFAGRAILVDEEIMLIKSVDKTANSLTVSRGAGQTLAATHSEGAGVTVNSNSLPNQVRLPLSTQDGETYLFTWDALWTGSYLRSGLTNHKAFQFTSGGDKIWLETQTRFSGASSSGFDITTDIASVTTRAYSGIGGNADYSLTPGLLGPGVTNNDPVKPKVGQFIIKPNQWTRFWVRIEQRADDYDWMDFWVADESSEAVKIYDQIPLSVRNGAIDQFWLEYNTSTDTFVRGDGRDLVSYFRNFVALRTSELPGNLFQRPLR